MALFPGMKKRKAQEPFAETTFAGQEKFPVFVTGDFGFSVVLLCLLTHEPAEQYYTAFFSFDHA